MKNFKMHVQSKLLSKLAITCLLVITASWLTFIGCAPVMDPVAKKAGGGKIADGGTPTPDDTPDPVIIPTTSIYLAVGNGGKIALSKDLGVSWEAVASGTTANLSDIATDGSNFVAVATNGTVVRSTDKGETWAVVSSTGISNSSSTEIEYGNGVFSILHYSVSVFSSGKSFEVNRSTDGGATWATGTIASDLFVSGARVQLAYNGSLFLAVNSTDDKGTIAVSANGLDYTSGLGNGNVKFGINGLDLRIANGRFFIFNFFNAGYNTLNIYHSPTGDSQWTTNRLTSAMDVTTFPAAASNMVIVDVAHSGSVYAFVGIADAGIIMTSATAMDGSFTLPTLPASSVLKRIIFFKGKFVIAGFSGTMLNGNAMGTTWTAVTSGTTETLSVGEATANKIVFTGGDNGKLLVSSDGTTWEEKSATGNTTKYNRLVLIE